MTLTTQQHEAVHSPAKRLVIIATAGSGKSRCIVARIRRLIDDGVDPASIVAISYTNAASNILQERLGDVKIGICSTLHSFMLRFLNHSTGAAHSVMDEDQRETLIESCIHDCQFKGARKAIDTILKAGPSLFIRLAGEKRLYSPPELVVDQFYRRMRKHRMIDFDSVLWFGLERIAAGHIEGLKQFTHILTDESQDLGTVHNEILDRLPIENKVWVGDIRQSIYSFLGGNVGQFAKRAETCTLIELTANFRSGPVICATANRLMEHNPEQFSPSVSANPNQPGSVEFMRFESEREEFATITADIIKNGCKAIQAIEASTSHEMTDEERVAATQTAILCRTNYECEQWSSVLAGMSIPVAKKTATRMPLDWRQCRKMLAFLANPLNDLLAFDWLASYDKGRAIEIKGKALKNLQPLNSVIKMPINVQPKDAPEYLAKSRISPESVALVKEASSWLQEGAGLSELILALNEHEIAGREEGHGVHVITYHSGKGREFDTVYLPGWAAGIFPKAKTPETLAEERRLAFVGITRARNRVVISHAKRRKPQWGPEIETEPSQFVKECGL